MSDRSRDQRAQPAERIGADLPPIMFDREPCEYEGCTRDWTHEVVVRGVGTFRYCDQHADIERGGGRE